MNPSIPDHGFEERLRMPVGTGVLLVTVSSQTSFFPNDLRLMFQDLHRMDDFGNVHPVELPNPAKIRLVVDGHPVLRKHHAIVKFDVATGTLSTELKAELPRGMLMETIRCFAPMGSPYLILTEYTVQTDHNAFVEITTGEWDGTPLNLHRVTRDIKDQTLIWRGDVVNRGSRYVLAEQTTSDPAVEWIYESGDAWLARCARFEAKAGVTYRFWKTVFAAHSDNAAYDNPVLRIERATRKGFAVLEKSTAAFWKSAWDRYGIDVKGEESVDQALRLSMYRLLITRPVSGVVMVNRTTDEESDAIRTYVPWIDVERFGAYVNVDKAAATAIVRRIVSCLPNARKEATRLGKRGAAYFGSACLHASNQAGLPIASTARVASLFVDYLDRTDVPQAILPLVYEALIETIRFLISCQTKDGRFPNIGVDDMVHSVVDHDAATVGRIEYVLQRAIDALEAARDAKSQVYQSVTLALDARRDLVLYKNALARIKQPVQIKGVYEAFEGYFGLAPIDTTKEIYGPERLPQLFGTQMLEVPRILDLFRLFPERYVKSVVKANWDYYASRICKTHARNGILLAIVNYQYQLGKFGYPEFLECLGVKQRKEPLPTQPLACLTELLRYDTHGYFMIVYAFGGVQLSEKYVKANANLPSSITSVRFRIVHRKNVATVKVGKEKCEWKWDVGGALK